VAEKRLIIAIFDAEADAHAAATAIKETGASVDDAIAVLVLDKDGKLKTDKVGTTSAGKGAAVGAALALLGPVGFGLGIGGGALLGKLHRKNLGLDDADRERLTTALQGGKAAVGVVANLDELVAVESILAGRGGVTEAHDLDEAALTEAIDSAGR
jgi:hypothetical protein